jgi:hypothetical protein
MPEAQLVRLFWEVLDRLAYTVMDARLSLFELMHGAELATPADEKRQADRNGMEALPVIDFGEFMASTDEPQYTELDRR